MNLRRRNYPGGQGLSELDDFERLDVLGIQFGDKLL